MSLDGVTNVLIKILFLKDLPCLDSRECTGIPQEPFHSFAEHSFETAMMAAVLALEYAPEIQWQHAASLGIIHELPNAILSTSAILEPAMLDHAVLAGLEDLAADTRKHLATLWQEIMQGKRPDAAPEAKVMQYAHYIRKESQRVLMLNQGYAPTKLEERSITALATPPSYLHALIGMPVGFLDKSHTKQYLSENVVQCLYHIASLKHLLRTGYHNRKIENGETVAEHMCDTALFGAILTPELAPECKPELVVAQALIHDLCEVISGDPTPGKFSAAEKRQREQQAFRLIIQTLNDHAREELIVVYDAYDLNRATGNEAQPAPEAGFVENLDRLQTVLQAARYAKQGNKLMADFFPWADQKITNPRIKEVYHHAKKQIMGE